MATKRAALPASDHQYSAQQVQFLVRYTKELETRYSLERSMREDQQEQIRALCNLLRETTAERDNLRATVTSLEARLARGRRAQQDTQTA